MMSPLKEGDIWIDENYYAPGIGRRCFVTKVVELKGNNMATIKPAKSQKTKHGMKGGNKKHGIKKRK